MKSLDEVISDMSARQSLYEIGHRQDYETVADALYYLKTYRANQQAYEENSHKAEEARERYLEAVRNCELAENKYRKLTEETSQKLRNTSQITCPKCHSEFVLLDDPDGDHQQLLKCQALLQDFYRHDPLTWSELKQMEGKPVYVKLLGAYESYPNASRWMLVQSDVSFGNVWFIDRSGARYCFYEKDMNDIWQAYRKERE